MTLARMEKRQEPPVRTAEVLIVGCGAAGLLAAVSAGELGLSCMALERRHRTGLKLLMCGNNRCNVSHDADVSEMLAAYGGAMAEFLRPALTRFPPRGLRSWFARNGLGTCVKNGRIYPTTENGDDVLHCFTDRLRDLGVPLTLNCPVTGLEPLPDGGWLVRCGGLSLTATCVLLATGGVSYPKTGSVGDGQRLLSELGVEVTPLRAGLAGVDVRDGWLQAPEKCEFLQVVLTVADASGRVLGQTSGNMLCDRGCLRGTAVFDATRLAAHHGVTEVSLTADLCPGVTSASAVASRLASGGLESLGVPSALAAGLRRALPSREVGRWLKAVPLSVAGVRPLKEAIVTVGGVALGEVNPETMELRSHPGLYVAGELLDVDGPTGGYNLHAAFATARLAVQSMAARGDIACRRPEARPVPQERGGRRVEPQERGGRRVERERGVPSSSSAAARPRSSCDRRPGNRWDNSELTRKWSRDGGGSPERQGQQQPSRGHGKGGRKERW